MGPASKCISCVPVDTSKMTLQLFHENVLIRSTNLEHVGKDYSQIPSKCSVINFSCPLCEPVCEMSLSTHFVSPLDPPPLSEIDLFENFGVCNMYSSLSALRLHYRAYHWIPRVLFGNMALLVCLKRCHIFNNDANKNGSPKSGTTNCNQPILTPHYHCPSCDAAFERVDHLRNHALSAHIPTENGGHKPVTGNERDAYISSACLITPAVLSLDGGLSSANGLFFDETGQPRIRGSNAVMNEEVDLVNEVLSESRILKKMLHISLNKGENHLHTSIDQQHQFQSNSPSISPSLNALPSPTSSSSHFNLSNSVYGNSDETPRNSSNSMINNFQNKCSSNNNKSNSNYNNISINRNLSSLPSLNGSMTLNIGFPVSQLSQQKSVILGDLPEDDDHLQYEVSDTAANLRNQNGFACSSQEVNHNSSTGTDKEDRVNETASLKLGDLEDPLGFCCEQLAAFHSEHSSNPSDSLLREQLFRLREDTEAAMRTAGFFVSSQISASLVMQQQHKRGNITTLNSESATSSSSSSSSSTSTSSTSKNETNLNKNQSSVLHSILSPRSPKHNNILNGFNAFTGKAFSGPQPSFSAGNLLAHRLRCLCRAPASLSSACMQSRLRFLEFGLPMTQPVAALRLRGFAKDFIAGARVAAESLGKIDPFGPSPLSQSEESTIQQLIALKGEGLLSMIGDEIQPQAPPCPSRRAYPQWALGAVLWARVMIDKLRKKNNQQQNNGEVPPSITTAQLEATVTGMLQQCIPSDIGQCVRALAQNSPDKSLQDFIVDVGLCFLAGGDLRSATSVHARENLEARVRNGEIKFNGYGPAMPSREKVDLQFASYRVGISIGDAKVFNMVTMASNNGHNLNSADEACELKRKQFLPLEAAFGKAVERARLSKQRREIRIGTHNSSIYQQQQQQQQQHSTQQQQQQMSSRALRNNARRAQLQQQTQQQQYSTSSDGIATAMKVNHYSTPSSASFNLTPRPFSQPQNNSFRTTDCQTSPSFRLPQNENMALTFSASANVAGEQSSALYQQSTHQQHIQVQMKLEQNLLTFPNSTIDPSVNVNESQHNNKNEAKQKQSRNINEERIEEFDSHPSRKRIKHLSDDDLACASSSLKEEINSSLNGPILNKILEDDCNLGLTRTESTGASTEAVDDTQSPPQGSSSGSSTSSGASSVVASNNNLENRQQHARKIAC